MNNNMHIFQRDFIINEYERLVKEEKDHIEDMVVGFEKHDDGKQHKTDWNVLPIGTFINGATLISPKPYLKDYMITFDANHPDNRNALIATLTRQEFGESILLTDDQYVEKLIQFSKIIPGF